MILLVCVPMYFMDVQLDQEALDAAYSQINYFSNVPKHIRGTVSEFKSIKTVEVGEFKPAHSLAEKVTVVSGKVNIPTFTETNEFSEKNYQIES